MILWLHGSHTHLLIPVHTKLDLTVYPQVHRCQVVMKMTWLIFSSTLLLNLSKYRVLEMVLIGLMFDLKFCTNWLR